MLTNDHCMRLEPIKWDQVPDQVHCPTVLIHRLNVGSSGQQLLDRLLQTATSRQVERTDGQTEGFRIYLVPVTRIGTFLVCLESHILCGEINIYFCHGQKFKILTFAALHLRH